MNMERARQLIRFPYGIVFILAGLDKIFSTNLIVYWPKYISPPVLAAIGQRGVLPFLVGMGIVEIIVGAMLLTFWPRLASRLGIAWLILISINLVLLGAYDIAIRDILLAFALLALAYLL